MEEIGSVPDRELFDRWARGDRRAAAELFERHFDGIERFFRNKIAEAPEDLVQQTFTECLQCHDRYRGDGAFRNYLFGIANNVLRAYYRTRSRTRRLDWAEVTAMELSPSPSSVVRARGQQQLLLESLRRIPVEFQVMLELYYWEEFPISAIAEALGSHEATVRRRLRQGRLHLQTLMMDTASSPAEFERTWQGLEQWARSVHGEHFVAQLEQG